MDPAEVAGAFDTLKSQGKVHEFGVSNFSPSNVTALQKACPMSLLKHPSRIIPIVGSTNPAHIQDATRADELAMSREE